MSSPEKPSEPSRVRIAGYSLIGAGAIAAVFGFVTLASGGQEEQAAPLPPEQFATSSARVPADSAEPAPAQPPQQDTSDTAAQAPEQRPGEAVPQDPEDTAEEPAPSKVLVRVYNNSTIRGLAGRAGEDLRRLGYEVPEVGNYSAGIIPTTTVYYIPGTEEERHARELATLLGARAEPRFAGIQGAKPGLIVILTNDYSSPSTPK